MDLRDQMISRWGEPLIEEMIEEFVFMAFAHRTHFHCGLVSNDYDQMMIFGNDLPNMQVVEFLHESMRRDIDKVRDVIAHARKHQEELNRFPGTKPYMFDLASIQVMRN